MPKRINFIPCVRAGLVKAGYSTVKVASAVNAALGELEKTTSEAKTGSGSVTKDTYKVTDTITEKFVGRRTLPLAFDAWHSAMEKANKIAEIDEVTIPTVFNTWLQKMPLETKEATEVPA